MLLMEYNVFVFYFSSAVFIRASPAKYPVEYFLGDGTIGNLLNGYQQGLVHHTIPAKNCKLRGVSFTVSGLYNSGDFGLNLCLNKITREKCKQIEPFKAYICESNLTNCVDKTSELKWKDGKLYIQVSQTDLEHDFLKKGKIHFTMEETEENLFSVCMD